VFTFALAPDPARKRLYMQGGRLDLSNLQAPTLSLLPAQGPIGVNTITGSYATTRTETADRATLYLYAADDTLSDTRAMPGPIWSIDVDSLTSRYFVTTRDAVNQLVVYNEGSRSVVFGAGLDEDGILGLPMSTVIDPISRNVFVNRSFQLYLTAWEHRPLVIDRSYGMSTPFAGRVLGTDPVRGLMFIYDQPLGADARMQVRDTTTFALADRQMDVAYWVGADPVMDRLYVHHHDRISVYDGTTGELLGQLPLGDGFLISNVAFVPGDDRLYVAGDRELPPSADTRFRREILVFATR
jgi:DNA-binding beta-propeller fold protein YncE